MRGFSHLLCLLIITTILKWMHTEAKDGPTAGGCAAWRSFPTGPTLPESGLMSATLLAGGKRGLPSLEKLLDSYRPRMVTIEVGIYDVEEKVPLETYA